MPSPEEFGNNQSVHGVGAPPNFEALKARARQIRQAAANNASIPEVGAPYTPPTRIAPGAAIDETYDVPMGAAVVSHHYELELVRTKFKLASYYEVLIAEPIFGDDIHTDPFAAQVHAEVTEWASNRMAELAGIRSNPEGFQDDEVRLLRSLIQSLGPNGVKALTFLADRVLNPPTPRPPQPDPIPEPSVADEDEGSSAFGFSSAVGLGVAAAPPQPAIPIQPQVIATKPKTPKVRRARIPGARVVAASPSPDVEPTPSQVPQKRSRKRSADPLAAGKALVAAKGQPVEANAPTATPAPAAAIPVHQPVPMPRGMAMTMAMEQKAGEADSRRQLVNGGVATGGGGIL